MSGLKLYIRHEYRGWQASGWDKPPSKPSCTTSQTSIILEVSLESRCCHSARMQMAAAPRKPGLARSSGLDPAAYMHEHIMLTLYNAIYITILEPAASAW